MSTVNVPQYRDLTERCWELYLLSWKSFLVGILALLRIVCIVAGFLVARLTDWVTRVAGCVEAWEPVTPDVFRWERGE